MLQEPKHKERTEGRVLYETRDDLTHDMGKIIYATLDKCIEGDWDENYITRSLLSNIRDYFSQVHLNEDEKQGKPSVCQIQAYGNRKKNNYEPDFGDIGILVRLNLGEGRILEGVALLEAKRIYTSDEGIDNVKTPEFSALKYEQLSKHVANTSNHRTVLYDFYSKGNTREVYAKTLPSQHMFIAQKNDRSIYPLTEDFSYCLTHRYMKGLELNYDREVIDGFKGNLSDRASKRYLLELDFCSEDDFKKRNDLLGHEINKDIYEEIEEGPLGASGWYPELIAV